jgi:hypothetical protein
VGICEGIFYAARKSCYIEKTELKRLEGETTKAL